MNLLKHLSVIAMSAMMALAATGCSDKENEAPQPDPADKTALQAELRTAGSLLDGAAEGNAPGQYPATAIAAFTAAIADAQAINDKDDATQQAVDKAVVDLKAAANTFRAAVIPTPTIDRSALQAALTDARGKVEGAVAGNEPGQYPADAITAFQTAIDAAQAVYDKTDATQAEIDGAVAPLTAAQATFLEAVIPSPTVDPALSLYLPFNGNAEDASSYGHAVSLNPGETGQPEPSLTADRMGAPDQAYRFEGGFMKIPYDATLNPSTMSVMFWMRMPALTATDTAPLSLGWWDCYMAKIIGGAQNDFAFVAGGASVMSGSTVEPDRWYHVAVTRSESSLDIYIDGELKNTQEAAAPMNQSTEPLRIGVLSENPGYYYPYFGDLDEIRIYSKVLSADEIKALYDTEKP